MPMPIRILLVDDHQILRDALRVVLERESDVILAGEAPDGESALKIAEECQPDVIVMDISIPGIGGIEATRRLMRKNPEYRIVALSTFSERRIVSQMLDAGAMAYVVKSAGREELLRAIRSVALKRFYLCPEVSAVAIESIRGRKIFEKTRSDKLGKREQEVLQLLAEGKTSPEIAASLYIATSTVEVHRRNIMRKLDLHSIAELTKYAIRHGLTSA